jgi:hypothetical protein
MAREQASFTSSTTTFGARSAVLASEIKLSVTFKLGLKFWSSLHFFDSGKGPGSESGGPSGRLVGENWKLG